MVYLEYSSVTWIRIGLTWKLTNCKRTENWQIEEDHIGEVEWREEKRTKGEENQIEVRELKEKYWRHAIKWWQ